MATRPKAVIESRNGEKFSPITITKNVLTDDGQNLHDILSDRKEDMMTPTIENSSSMFKVGQGDNVDYSSNVVNGAYESMVLKGKTMVNCIQESSSKDVVLPYEFADGQYVTINDTKESGTLGVELKGQTLVNVVDYNDLNLKNATRNGDYFILRHGVDINQSWVIPKKNKQYLYKPNTVYTIIVNITENTTGQKLGISNIYTCTSYINGKNRFDNLLGESKLLVRTGSDVNVPANQNEVRQLTYFGIWDGSGDLTSHIKFNFMILEGDWTDKETPPYFEGMASCKRPVLKTCGKNLFDIGKDTNHCWQGTTEFVDGRIKVTSTHNDGVTFHRTYNIPVKKGRTYYVNVNREGNGYWYLWKNGDTTKSLNNPFTVDDTFDSVAIGLYCAIGEGNVCYFKPQIEEGTVATTYEDHKTSILSLPEEIVLGGLGDTRDTFNSTTGKYTKRTNTMTVTNYKNSLISDLIEGAWSIVLTPPNKKWQTTTLCVSDKFSMGGGHNNRDCGFYENPVNFVFFDKTVNSADEFIAKYGDFSFTYILETPIVTKINLPSTLKSWNTTTHIYSEIPENSLYPTLSHSNPSYPVILKPSTKYSIVSNSYSNSHTNSPINFNLGGATASTTVGNRVTTITTPSTLSNELLTMSGRGNMLNNVMVIEGDIVGDEPYFEGICDCKSPILSNVGKNLFDSLDSTMKSSWWIIVENGVANVKKEDLSTNYSVIIPAQSNTKYKVSGNNFTRSFYAFLDKDYNVLHADEMVQRTTKSLSPQGTAYALFYLNHEDIEKVTNLQIEEGSTATPYEPYKSNTTTFEQKDGKTIVLRSLPNGVCDTLNVETGEYVQRIGEVLLDGSSDEKWNNTSNAENVETLTQFNIGTAIFNGALPKTANDESVVKNAFIQNMFAVQKATVWTYQEGEACAIHMPNPTHGSQAIQAKVLRSRLSSQDVAGWRALLQATPWILQYELATPIVSTVDIQGFPYAYKNGHVILSSGSIEQSLTPKVEYSVATNRNGQIRSNQKMVERHQKQLDRLQAMILTNLVNTQYEQTLTNLKYDLKNVREEVK